MKWSEACFNETLRMGGPSVALFPRIASVDLNLGGLPIPKGTSVSMVALTNHFKK